MIDTEREVIVASGRYGAACGLPEGATGNHSVISVNVTGGGRHESGTGGGRTGR